MINPKNICICSCIGFFLSFFIGLVSGIHFSNVLIRALFFALLFGALSAVISFVYNKFLSNETSTFASDSDSSVPKTSGSVVNIVVDDSTLPDDGLAPKFTVLNNRPSLQKTEESVPSDEGFSDLKPNFDSLEPVESTFSSKKTNESPVVEEKKSEPAFKPVDLANPAAASSAADSGSKNETASSKSEVSVSEPAVLSSEVVPQQLDELPDIGTIDTNTSSSGSSSDFQSNEVVSDTEFATGGSALKEQPVNGDTNVMAKAIQTLLAQDNN